ncbi:rRNA methyltransferase 1, mitochondrial isoform X2 [Globicephala melas]|uniref:rRNA methyltransferase 1, mitochondrial isoform X2 n=1 Tax=Globicephala melas TaxID=9731 RepID=UPI00293D34DF|nr:rRNA methyltransferase 1, mitochondrial isoform X2 [Globicephala melas]
MALLSAVGGATWHCCGRLLTRPFSQASGRGERPGGEELSRLLLDDLAPTPRPAGGLELLFGLSPCLLALRAARRRVARLLLQAGRSRLQGERAELLRAAEARDIPVLRPSRRKLDVLCRYQVHQGVCMEVSPLRPRPWAEAGEARPGDDPQQLWLVLEGLQDPRNLGAVLRSAHFLGVDKVITSRRNSCPLSPVVSKASAGAMEVMDVFSTDDLAGFLQTYPAQLMATPPCLQLFTPQNLGTLLDSSYSHHVPPVGISFCFYLDVISTFSPFLTISTVTTLVQATIISSLYHCRNLTGLLVSASGSQHRQSDSVET